MIRRRGFTLIELMIVVAIIGLLAAIAVPKFAELLRKAQEGNTRGNLGRLRSTLSIYYADMEGQYPTGAWQSNSSVLDSLVPKYIDRIPAMRHGPYHNPGTAVFCHQNDDGAHDGSGWGYCGAMGYGPGGGPDTNWGKIWVMCTHTDTKSSFWYNY